MERLTIRNGDGSVSQPTAVSIEDVFYRLAAYEDTGLSPEDLSSTVDIDYARIVELLKSDAEGRVVVLPCKVGQTVYKISHYHDCVDNLYETCDLFAYDESACCRCYKDKLVPYIREVGFELSMLDELGNIVFVSREEAEAVIAKDKNVPTKENAADINVGVKSVADLYDEDGKEILI